MRTETIAAVATAMSHAGIGIIRISGPEALTIIDKIYRSKNNKKKLSNCKTHTIHYGFIYDGEELLDEVLVSIMLGPNSYTGEDTVEINCHGGILVMRKVLQTVFKYGARPAEAGEFTKRAFLNGRMDLSQAEAVIDVINSKNDLALKSSVNQLHGTVSKKIKELRAQIIYEIAFIESALDDPEHISLDGYADKLLGVVSGLLKDMKELLSQSENGRLLSEGIKTVILGKPNAGKSSLLNLLLGEERAIVTEIAGTTRDTLEEEVYLDGITLRIIDTAGIRDTGDIVEKIGVDKAIKQAGDADLILYVVDSSSALDENDEEIIKLIQNKKAIVLLNKSDLEGVISSEELQGRTGRQVLSISAKENTGITALIELIKQMFFEGQLETNDEWFLTNERQKASMKEAYDSLMLVRTSIESGMPEDFYSIDLMNAYEQLGFIIGESVEEDLVNEIFAKFCMGK